MAQAIPWILSAWTLTTMWLAGNGTKWAWASGLASQGLWLTYAYLIGAWGLMPLSFALAFVYVRNWRKTTRFLTANEYYASSSATSVTFDTTAVVTE